MSKKIAITIEAVAEGDPLAAAMDQRFGRASAFLFVDGGHGREPAMQDFSGWAPHVASGGSLAIHDVFPNPADGGRPPYEEIYLPALESGDFAETSATGSLRILQRR